MLILASEDVGLADPNALRVVEAAAAAFDRVGLPEGRFHLAQAALYLATAPKSNSIMGFFDALSTVENEREGDVPTHLKDDSRDREGFGHGEGYLYPHAYRDHWVAQQYLPDALQGQVFYRPSDQGYERQIKEGVQRRREEQLAAAVEGSIAFEGLTFSPADRSRSYPVVQGRERWLMRAISDSGRNLGVVRDRVLDQVSIRRHHLILDLNAGTGLLTWEALRRVPEGGVWSLARDELAAEALRQQAERLPELERPILLVGRVDSLPELVARSSPDQVRFDLIVGRNSLTRHAHKAAAACLLESLLLPGGAVSLAEAIPRRAQRLYALVDTTALGMELSRALREAEEAIYAEAGDPMTNWDADDLREAFAQAGFDSVKVETVEMVREYPVTRGLMDRWFSEEANPRPSYAQHLARSLPAEAIAEIRALFERKLVGSICRWRSTVAFLLASK